MNWSNIETGWAEFKANAKQQWTKLSAQQIDDTLGKREQLSESVQLAYAMSKDEAERQISEWQSKQVEKQQASGCRRASMILAFGRMSWMKGTYSQLLGSLSMNNGRPVRRCTPARFRYSSPSARRSSGDASRMAFA